MISERSEPLLGDQPFDGEHFHSPGCYAEPKPVQRPYPIVMSAGTSEAGRRLAMQHADLIFCATTEYEAGRTLVAGIRKTAREEYHRPIDVYGMA